MHLTIKPLIALLGIGATMLSSTTVCAVDPIATNGLPDSLNATLTDTADMAIRLNPEIADCGSSAMADSNKIMVVTPGYINRKANHIILNGADWSRLHNAIAGTDSTTVSIVHIGDSHIQADYATGHVRQLMQNRYGNAGRGLITPLKMTGTNEPRDYTIKSSRKTWRTAKLMKKPWQSPMSFTGTSITPTIRLTDLTIATLSRDEPENPFDSIRIFHNGDFIVEKAIVNDQRVDYNESIGNTESTITLPSPTCSVTLQMRHRGKLSLFGFELLNGSNGILYHTIGNNGATFGSYNAIDKIGDNIARLTPDLVVVSLGANEAFGNITPEAVYESIDTFVCDIRRHSPNAAILLTTPMECQKSQRIRGKRRRRARSYSVNTKIAQVRDIILSYGRDNGIAVYDWYEVAGGNGASAKWLADKLLNTDRIHNTRAGYMLQGQLLFDAIELELQHDANIN